MERIFICNDIWFDCLPFLSRAKVGLAFALVSDRFDRVSDRHLGSKKRSWTLGRLQIKQRQNESIIVKNYWTENEEHLPLPDGPLHENVIGFEHINISYIDHKVINFLCRIRRLFQPTNNGNDDGIGLAFGIDSSQMTSWHIFCVSIFPLINPSAITKLSIRYNSFDFCGRISPTFLRDLANLRVVNVIVRLDGETNSQLLCEWLHTPRKDGKPKLLKHCNVGSNALEQFKTTFLSAETAVSFIIPTRCGRAAVPFEVDNRRTGERLTFRPVVGTNRWLLERGPIGGRNVEKWAKWEREAMELQMMDQPKHNLLDFCVYDNDIGSLDESAGPTGQQPQQKRIKLDEK